MAADPIRLAIAVALTAAATPAGAADPIWPEASWNPAPAGGDVTLPMPCGGAMTFRRVDTAVQANWLADESVQLGNSDISGQEHSESILSDSVVGSLSLDGTPDARFYLIGKYEVTRDQYAAVMDADCPQPGDDGTLPAEDMPWFDALSFTARYTQWLHGNAAAELAAAAGEQAFVRLPTEEEWEYAARGGDAVPEAVQRQRLFPMDGPLEDYVWFAGYKSCDGAVQPIGALAPNPLGIHDILGNVQEMTADLYRLRTRARQHGEVGGATARGGSCLTSATRVRTAQREEIALFDPESGVPVGKPYTGIRLAVGSPILVGQDRIARINDDWKAFGETRIHLEPGQDPIEALEAIAAAQDSPEVRDAILEAARTFDTEMERRNVIEMKSAKSVLMSGTLMVRDYLIELNYQTPLLRILQRGPNEDAEQGIARSKERLAITQSALLTAILHAAEDFDQPTLAAAEELVAKELAQRLQGMTDRTRNATGPSLTMFGDFVALYQQKSDTEPAVIYKTVENYFAALPRQ